MTQNFAPISVRLFPNARPPFSLRQMKYYLLLLDDRRGVALAHRMKR